ncbi:adenylate cyclase [Acuticoccus sediminis]|uniref:Adenylate cyclase n=2 Tax=Acuticoccus sediminis TaxID=2184697 RepID=A0A8B2P315_9HYPH|nr:adenylate cyclase [Acuticoccus sediminis]
MHLPESPMDIGSWLRSLGLGRYEAAFRDNDVDAALLSALTSEDLREIGITSLGHRKRLLAALAELRSANASLPGARIAERRHLTVMFVDLAGSTELSRRLDPEDLRRLLRAYHDTVRATVERGGGHVAKFMGDGVLAYFGWPRAEEAAGERAVRAGLATTAAVANLSFQGEAPLSARVGIASGLVVVGDLIGEGAAQEETVFGETPNLAARLQEVAGPGGVVIADATRSLVGEMFRTRPCGPLFLKGFADPIAAHHVIGARDCETRFEVLHPGVPPPMVGRDQELALVMDRWKRARGGEGQAVLVVGEAGIGKSRLIQAVYDALANEKPVCLRYQCSPLHQGIELWPVVQHILRAAGIAPSDDAEAKRGKLARLFGDVTGDADLAVALVADLVGAGGPAPPAVAGLGAAPRRARTLALLVDQVVGLARAGALLLVVEDVHWIDPTTLEFLAEILERVGDQPILVLLTSRPDNQPTLGRGAPLTQLSLDRLGRAASGAIVARLRGRRALPEAVRSEIIARTDGVPLFVEELTKAVLEAGIAGLPGTVPASLQASLMARLDRLPDIREVAQTAACIGREFAWPLLAAVSPLPDDELAAALDRLVAAELVFRTGTPPEARYTFKHALVRDAAHESLLKVHRQEVHHRIALAIEERFPQLAEAEPGLLAEHHAAAGDLCRAVDGWQRAAERALARFAMKEAAVQIDKGLAAVAGLPAEPGTLRRELRLQRARGQASLATLGFAAPETGAAYARAQELCLSLGEAGELYPVLYGLSVFHFQRGDLDRAHAVALELVSRGEATGDVPAQITGHRMIGSALSQMGRFVESRAEFERVLSLYDPDRDRDSAVVYAIDSRVMSTCWLTQLELILGNRDSALAHFERIPGYVSAVASATTTAVAHAWNCIFLQLLDDPDAARLEAERTTRVSLEHGYPLYAATGTVIRGWALARQGMAEDGAAEIRRGLANYSATGAVMWVPYFLGLLAESEALAGRPQAGLRELYEAFVQVGRHGLRWIEPELHRIRGTLAPTPETSTGDFRSATALAREQGAALWIARTQASMSTTRPFAAPPGYD